MKKANAFVVVFVLFVIISFIVVGIFGLAYFNLTHNKKIQTQTRNDKLYPNPELIKFSYYNVSLEELCTTGYTKTIRNVPMSLKNKVFAEYGVTYEQVKGTDYEIDHYLPLCLSGTNDLSNLWYMESPYYKWKDRVELHLCREVCNNEISLEEAQDLIYNDWYSVYLEINNTLIVS